MLQDFHCDYDIDNFLEILNSLDNDISNFIYIMELFKNNDNNENEKMLIGSYIKVLSLVLQYNSLFEQILYIKKEGR